VAQHTPLGNTGAARNQNTRGDGRGLSNNHVITPAGQRELRSEQDMTVVRPLEHRTADHDIRKTQGVTTVRTREPRTPDPDELSNQDVTVVQTQRRTATVPVARSNPRLHRAPTRHHLNACDGNPEILSRHPSVPLGENYGCPYRPQATISPDPRATQGSEIPAWT
jgi:hypothetical protein